MKDDAERAVEEAYLLIAGAQYVLENYGGLGDAEDAEGGKSGQKKAMRLMMSAVCLAEWRLKEVLELEDTDE